VRFAVDTGGTFTDLVIEDDRERVRMFKAPTTPGDPVAGIMDAVGIAAESMATSVEDLLAAGSMFIHGTTHAINAVITGNTARTALLTTAGHPDVLVFREGGRIEPFNFAVPFPEPYVPRALTFEVPERIAADGQVVEPLDEPATVQLIGELAERDVESIDCQPGPRAARRGAAPGAAAAGSLHPLARPQPDPARVPASVVDRDRRVAQAAHVRLSRRAVAAAA
jgi:N-methylhydantoinase A